MPVVETKPQDTEEQKQVISKSATGKLKIKPIMMKVYATNEKIDPGVNPFVGQQLILDDSITTAATAAPTVPKEPFVMP